MHAILCPLFQRGSATAAPASLLQCVWAVVLLLLTLPAFVQAVTAPAPRLDANDYIHVRWTTDDGAPAAVNSMAQTTDGWLWLGALDGLYRFDGIRFSRFPLPSRLGLNRNRITFLLAGAKGELYIGHGAEGATILYPDGRLAALPTRPLPVASVEQIAVDPDGSLWAVSDGILHLVNGQWHMVEQDTGFKQHDARSFLMDQRGNLWFTRPNATWRLDRGTGRFKQMLDAGGDLVTAPDGALWLVSDNGQLRMLTEPGARRPALATHAQSSFSAQFADDGTLWALSCPGKPCLTTPPAQTQQFNFRSLPSTPLVGSAPWSGETARAILIDREGNIWINTDTGLNKFYRKRFVDSGLPGFGLDYSIAADNDGKVWAANIATGVLSQLRPDGAVPVATPAPVTVLARAPDGSLVRGGRRSILRDHNGTVDEIALPQDDAAQPQDRRMLGVLDDGVYVWTATFQTGLAAWRDNKWTPARQFRLPAKIYQSARAGIGKLWLATGDGELFLYDAHTDSNSAPIDIRAIGMTTTIFPGNELFISGDTGSGVVRQGALFLLHAADQNVLRNVSGQVMTPDGDRWLNSAAGLVHVAATDWRRSIQDPAIPLRYELFDNLDGYPGRAVIENRWLSAASGDGRYLWLITTGGVVRFDTQNIARNRTAPVPSITALATDTTVYATGGPVRLPPGVNQFRIDFTAPALRMPARVRFEYRLDGVDAEWKAAGTRRATNYTNIGPGHYTFHVRAINEDGVRSHVEATLPVTIVPTFLQTVWFKLLIAAALALLLGCAYRYRILYLTRRFSEQLQVKLAERERIARTLHDTFLQTMHSVLLNVDAVAAKLPAGDVARAHLEKVRDQASTAIGEGRDQLQELRSGQAQALEAVLEKSLQELQKVHDGITLGLRVTGAHTDVPAGTIDEINYIVREAVRNACTHAAADQVRVTLAYDADGLTVTIADNGRGMDAALPRKGPAQGHWGLVGMRERAGRIGASLAIDDGAEGGTVVRLHVSALGTVQA